MEDERILECINDSRNSFYKKAMIRTEDNKTILRSYCTDVAYIEDGKAVVNGAYSSTTFRHIKEFLKQHGFRAETSKQILEDYTPTKEQIKKESELNEEKANSMFKSVKMVASLGDLFCDKQKDKNDWKLRMLKAGLETKGLIIPEDWNTLNEDEKEERLNNVINVH